MIGMRHESPHRRDDGHRHNHEPKSPAKPAHHRSPSDFDLLHDAAEDSFWRHTVIPYAHQFKGPGGAWPTNPDKQ